MKDKFLLSVIIPVFNEEENIHLIVDRLTSILKDLSYEIVFVNDGSRDNTLENIRKIAAHNKNIKAVSFVRNFGHQMALSAGYENVKGDVVVTIDADLQDPPELILEMVQKWKKGFKIIYAKREERKDGAFKKYTAYFFYRLLNIMSDTPIPTDVGDYRLLDREVVTFLNNLPEKTRYWRGLVAWGGFKSTEVFFKRLERIHGETHYPFSKMLSLAFDGITSFSTKPLRMAMYLGFITSTISVLVILFKMIQHLLYPQLYWAPGWASLFFAIVFLGGVQLITLGIIGEYIGKIYREIQARPRFLIGEKINI
jgi:dolichol-phosphate mannosyltransferase